MTGRDLWFRSVLLAGALAGVLTGARAEAQKPVDSIGVVTPVFHQLVAFKMPTAFRLDAPEQVSSKSYLRESVLRGETPERWTQMITLTGAHGARGVPGLTPERFLENIASGYKQACPESFAIKPIGATTITGQPGYLALVSCGSVADENGAKGARHSETALLVGIAGDQDLYTIQWAERGTVSEKPLPFDEAKWQALFRALGPIQVCARVEGEQAPYPSCIGR